jgi:hypothetical protein
MNAFRIFIASSTPTQALAQQLFDRIKARARTFTVEPVLWWEAFQLGEGTLAGLIDECKICDFAAIFLTEDDVTLKKGIEQLQPRDNCIFEAGLFTGALSLEPKRVFLLTSVRKAADALPSDLASIVYVPIKVSGSKSEIDGSIDTAAGKIIEAMLREGPHHRGQIPYIPEQELMSFERLEADAGRLIPASRIFVHTGQPMEAFDPAFAERVQRNIRNAIRYRYFFHADRLSVSMIAQLIWTLGVAGVEGEDVAEKNSKIEKNPELVLGNLKSIYRNLNVYFLSEQPHFELCIHNSEVMDKAVCYLRVPDTRPIQFIEWCQGTRAKDIAESFLSLRKNPAADSIFKSTGNFDLDQQTDYLKELCREVVGRFPSSIESEVRKLCFGI